MAEIVRWINADSREVKDRRFTEPEEGWGQVPQDPLELALALVPDLRDAIEAARDEGTSLSIYTKRETFGD